MTGPEVSGPESAPGIDPPEVEAGPILEADQEQVERTSRAALSPEEQRSLGLFGLFLITLLISSGLYFLLQEDELTGKPAELRIDYVFTQLMDEDELTYTFDMKVLITNTAQGPAKNVRIEIAGIDNAAKLTYDRSNASGFDIPAQNTTERSVILVLPKVTAHKMFVMVFVDDELKLKGYSIVSVEGSSSRRDFQVTYKRGINESLDTLGNGQSSETASALGFFFVLLVVIELTVVVATIRRDHLGSALSKLFGYRRKR